jgi:hypothetical protein
MEKFVLALVLRVLRWLLGWVFRLLWPVIRMFLITAAVIAAVVLLVQLLRRRGGRRARA